MSTGPRREMREWAREGALDFQFGLHDSSALSSSPDDAAYLPSVMYSSSSPTTPNDDDDFDLELALRLSAEEAGLSTPSTGGSNHHRSTPSKRRGQVSLNHLLRFNVVSAASSLSSAPSSTPYSGSVKHKTSVQPRHLTLLKKDLYIQANHRVVLYPGGDYEYLLENPDNIVRWMDIAQVHFDPAQATNCPICLERPRAPKMTRCGHVFCWDCLLQLLTYSSNEKSVQCPICTEVVILSDLRSVFMYRIPTPLVGDKIELTLMKRSRSVNFVTPAAVWDSMTPGILPKDNPVSRFSQFATANSLSEIVEWERTQLEQALHEARSCEDRSVPFIETALEQLERDHTTRRRKFETAAAQRQHYGAMTPGQSTSPPLSSPSRTNDKAQGGEFYFYQASDGQLVYLSPLDAKILLAEYRSFANFPTTVTGTIVAIKANTMDPDVRRRSPWLSHLPLSAPFLFVELKFPRGAISPEVRQQFTKELNARKRKITAARAAARAALTASCPSPTTTTSSTSTEAIPASRDDHIPAVECLVSSTDAFPSLTDAFPSSTDESNNDVPINGLEQESFLPGESSAVPSFADVLKSTQQRQEPRLPPLPRRQKKGRGKPEKILLFSTAQRRG